MKQYKFIFNKKMITIVILLITFGVTYLIYQDTYNLNIKADKLALAINDYIFSDDVNAEIQLIHKEKDWAYVVFTDSRHGNIFMGMVRLKHGWNGKYVLYDANYGMGYPVSRYQFRDNHNKFAVYGFIPDDRAKRYEYISSVPASKGEVKLSGDIAQKAFVQIYDHINDDLLRLKLYDSTGNDITETYSIEGINNSPTGSVSTAELFMVDFICGFVLFLGILLAFTCWHKQKP